MVAYSFRSQSAASEGMIFCAGVFGGAGAVSAVAAIEIAAGIGMSWDWFALRAAFFFLLALVYALLAKKVMRR